MPDVSGKGVGRQPGAAELDRTCRAKQCRTVADVHGTVLTCMHVSGINCFLQLAEISKADQLMSRLSRVAAAINLRTSDPLTESGHDPVVELR